MTQTAGSGGAVTLNFFSEMEFDEARDRYASLVGETYCDYLGAIETVAQALERNGRAVMINLLSCDLLETWAEQVGCEVDSVAVRAACPLGEQFDYEGEGTLWALSHADTALRLAGWCGERDEVDYAEVVEEAARAWNPLTARIEQLCAHGAVLSFATAVSGGQGWAVEIPLVAGDGGIVVPNDAYMRALVHLVTLGYINGAVVVLHCFDDDGDSAARVYGWELGPGGFVGMCGDSVRAECARTVGWGDWDQGAVFLDDSSF